MTIVAQNVWKSFGGRIVLKGVSVRVGEDERVALLGANGTGKSTLLQIVAGVLEADRGHVDVEGMVGFAPEKPDLPAHLLVHEWLDVVASLKGTTAPRTPPFGTAPLLGKVIGTLSLGQRQRVSLAAAFLGDPSALVLDEPTNGLDAATFEELAAALVHRSALVATHDRAFASAIGARALELGA